MKTRVSYISITFTGGDYSQSSDSISAITISENAECKIQGTTNGGQLTIDPETMCKVMCFDKTKNESQWF